MQKFIQMACFIPKKKNPKQGRNKRHIQELENFGKTSRYQSEIETKNELEMHKLVVYPDI